MRNPKQFQAILPYRPDLQGLRAIAIALVILAHAHVPGFAGGFVGVDVFFVLSGYLITGLLLQEQQSEGRIRYGRFLARRLRRLLPALLAISAVSMVLALLLLTPYEARSQTGSFNYAMTWTSNLFFALSQFDYFSALTAKDMFLHTWSLAVEEQFYIVWPAFIAIAVAFSRVAATRTANASLLSATFLLLGLCSLILCVVWTQKAPLLGFYMMPARAWQFALGGIVSVWILNRQVRTQSDAFRTHPPLIAAAVGLVGLAMVFGSAILLRPTMAYPGLYAIIPTLGAVMLIYSGGHSDRTGLQYVLQSAPFVWLGDRSYSLYLWHWPILVLGGAYSIASSKLGTAGLVLLSILLATLSYRWIELPFWKGRFSAAAPRHTAMASVILVLVTVGGMQYIRHSSSDMPSVASQPERYKPRFDLPPIYGRGMQCDTWYSSDKVVPCIVAEGSGERNVLLFGDSIGAQWVSLFAALYAGTETRVTVLTKSGCAIVDEEYYYDPVGGIYETCSRWRDAAISYIAKIRPDILIVGSSSHYAFSRDQWTGGIARVLEQLKNEADAVILIPGTPSLSFNGPSCLNSPNKFWLRLRDSKRECEEALAEDDSERVAKYLEEVSGRFKNAKVLNLNDLVCPDRRCAAQTIDGVTVFRDERHLTDAFVRAQAGAVATRLKRLDATTMNWLDTTNLASAD